MSRIGKNIEKIVIFKLRMLPTSSFLEFTVFILSMDYSTLKRKQLLEKCKEFGIKKYHNKKKVDLIQLLSNHNTIITKKQLKPVINCKGY